ncbi:hypothetical protein [Brevibacillus parabrevis]|uniref:hypothetical protein n=1 Tax=Brevibacillus parabrevis TaxID=54914 RepID=UPI0028530C80|nr:hypothetical protein [Brevibacillus parabrevis]MDR4997880.1 hypothetical protein [Brevibacillus parabrevis]
MDQWYRCMKCKNQVEGIREEGIPCEKCGGGPFLHIRTNSQDNAMDGLAVMIEIAPWHDVFTQAMAEALAKAAQAGMPEHLTLHLMRAATSESLAEAIVVTKGKGESNGKC